MNLRRLLHVQTLRQQVSEKTGKKKDPVSMMYSFPEELDTFITSKTDGSFEAVQPKDNEQVMSNFFPVKDESNVFRPLIEFVFEHSADQDWGNVASVEEVDEKILEDVLSFFQSYDLDAHWTFCSFPAYQNLVESGMLISPENETELAPQIDTKEALVEYQKEHLHVGKTQVFNSPVFFVEDLGPYLVFSAPKTFVGMFTRCGDHINVVLHNSERALVILKLEGVDDDFSRENNEESPEERDDEEADELPDEEGSDKETD